MIVVGATVIHLVDGINRRRGLIVTRCGQVYRLFGQPPGVIRPDGKFDAKWVSDNDVAPYCLCSHCRDRWPRRKPGRHRSAYRRR